MSKPIYNLQRFQILQTKLNTETTDLISNSYAYAWYYNLFPFFDDEVALHEDLETHFTITKEQVDSISQYADSEWNNGRLHTFYDYEAHYSSRNNPTLGITRHVLLRVFRYLYLKDLFDEDFWNKLLEQMNHPTEASGITRDFDLTQIYLV